MSSNVLDIENLLSENAFFAGADSADVSRAAQMMQIQRFPPGQVIFHFGDTNDDVYFLLSGSVIGQLVAESGREIVFTEMRMATFFGEMAALDGQPRSVTVSAKEDVVVARLKGAQFNALMERQPRLAVNLAVELARRVRVMNERMFGLVVHDVGTRVRLHLMRLAQEQGKLVDGAILDSVPTHEEIATFIGANREAVSRAITRLNKSGLVEASRKSILIKDCDGLLDGLEIAES
ncbi:Crp/Fnr family transcriptional regulator [Pseudooctadecabacter sp.]|uniref:Crp/Fnr family transcriptional regulator n=1 Tax=Pseudooctadecabacter sp. TaxID=1966338 RepID=UPI0025CB83FD|nr:Crp/Fnr family transcriptional regulator [Pseudooctadecabacter sp.]